MATLNPKLADAERVNLRTILDTIGREIGRLPAAGTGEGDAERRTALEGGWASLIALLAVDAAPETRECPNCKGTVMRGATRCIHCWAQIIPLPPSKI